MPVSMINSRKHVGIFSAGSLEYKAFARNSQESSERIKEHIHHYVHPPTAPLGMGKRPRKFENKPHA